MSDRDDLPEGFTDAATMDNPDSVMSPDGSIVTREQMNAIVEQATDVATTADAASWMNVETEHLEQQLKQRKANRDTFLEWVMAQLVDGVDYGRVKNKPSLWKPGAEKVTGMLGLRCVWPDLEEVAKRLMEGGQVAVIRCLLVNEQDVVISEGMGARTVRQDGGDVNKAIKMAKKSAHIDAAINVSGLSAIFTQDMVPEPGEDPDDIYLTNVEADYLRTLAEELFPGKGPHVLESLARQRFHIESGDFTRIRSYRFEDAERSLREKHAAETPADD